MKAKTKFEQGDQVWFKVRDTNSYSHGKIEAIGVYFTQNSYSVKYTVTNRQYKPSHLCVSYNDPHAFSVFDLEESEVFESLEKLKVNLLWKAREEIEDMTEFK